MFIECTNANQDTCHIRASKIDSVSVRQYTETHASISGIEYNHSYIIYRVVAMIGQNEYYLREYSASKDDRSNAEKMVLEYVHRLDSCECAKNEN